MEGVLWKVAKRLSYIQDARCLEPNTRPYTTYLNTINLSSPHPQRVANAVKGKFIILKILLRVKMIMFLIMHFSSSPCSRPVCVEILSWVPCSHSPSNLLQRKNHASPPRNTTNKIIILSFIYLSNSFLFNYTVSSSDCTESKYGSISNLKGTIIETTN